MPRLVYVGKVKEETNLVLFTKLKKKFTIESIKIGFNSIKFM
jgi:hypothetical protein